MGRLSRRASAVPEEARSLAARIRARLTVDPRFDLRAMRVRVRAHDDWVGLTGWVNRLAEKRWIEADVADIVGAGRMRSCLIVGPPGMRPDQEISAAVRDALAEDRSIDATAIRVKTVNGIVRLDGIVGTLLQRKFAGALCWWIRGVREVSNHLSVLYPEPENDELLGEVIQAVMEKDPLVDRSEILVLVHDGVVTLAGTVGGKDARVAAEDDAWIVEGVRAVANEIEVVPGGRIDGLGG